MDKTVFRFTSNQLFREQLALWLMNWSGDQEQVWLLSEGKDIDPDGLATPYIKIRME